MSALSLKPLDSLVARIEKGLAAWPVYRIFIMYRLHISLLFLAMVLVHFSRLADRAGYAPILAFTCWHIALYVFNRYTDREEDRRNAPGEALDHWHGRLALAVTWLLLAAGGAALYLSGKPLDYYVLSLPGVFLYGLRIPALPHRIKDVTFLKTAYAVLVCWCLPVLLVAATYQGEIRLTPELSKFLLLLFFFTTCYELLADIKDIPGDREAGVKTMAVRYGESTTRTAVIALIVMAWLLSTSTQAFFGYAFFSYPFAALILGFAFLVRPHQPALYFHGLIFATTAAVGLYYFLNVFPSLSGFSL